MESGTIFFILYSSISITVSSIVAYLFWKRRRSVGAFAMFLLMLCTIDWSLSNLLSTLNGSLQMKLFWDNLTYPGIVFIPVIWFIFSFQYTRQYNFLKVKYYLFLSIIPFTTLVMVFTGSFRHLFSVNTRTVLLPGSSLFLVVYDFGVWFWIHTAYSYTLILLGMVILLRRLVKFSRVYRNQAIIMISAVLVPLIGEALYLLGLSAIKNLDTTPFSFSFTGLLLFIGMFRFKILDLVPIAREAIIDNMDNLMIVLDKNNRIIDINNSGREVFGGDQKELIGLPLSVVIKDKLEIFENITSLKTNEKIVVERDGIKKYYSAKLSPLFNKRKAIVGSFIVLNDITNLEEAMKKLEESKSAAENANRAKSEFLAAMSHEIRTPINGIIGMAELLESANLTTQERENLGLLRYSADSLLNIINEILDFSKIEAGKMELENIGFNIKELVLNTAKTFNYNKKIENINFTCRIDEGVPEAVIGDPVRLRQILTNLLSNAFKFTEKGSINLDVSINNSFDNIVLLKFCVSDTGIGIPEDKINNLFQSFHQLDSSTTRKYGGTGLGLSIVKKIVELMKGSIKVESHLGCGSNFIFEIPFKLVTESLLNEISSESQPLSAENRLKILVAEDSRINQLIMKQFLNKRNWECDTAENGRKAIEMLDSNTYDMVLMDIQMPEMDGYEAAKIIREKERSSRRHIPIIALTANATEDDRNKCLESGMDDFLSKPIKSEKLYSCIMNYTG